MTKKELLVAGLLSLVVLAAAADTASAKSVGSLAAPQGVTVRGSDYRYVAISPGTPGRVTVVARVERDGGRLSRWWYLRGSYQVPAVAYDISPGGLSADGRTLVLSRFSRVYPPRTSRFAILDTKRSFEWRRPGRPPRVRRFFDHVELRGDFSFDAISPDGSTVYLIERYLPPSSGGNYISTYKVRALDVASGKLLPRPIVDPREPDEKMQGLPITRATSLDGRWAYTLYDGNGDEPFIHALDTVGRTAVCIDLPQLENRRNLFMLKLRLNEDGERLAVMSGPRPPRKLPPLEQGRPLPQPPPHPLLMVDTASFEVAKESVTAGEADEGLGLASASAGLAIVAFTFGLIWLVRRRRVAHERAGAA